LDQLVPGTWFYRVRGLDPYLPGSAKQMAWSDPVQIVVTPPTFVIVGGAGTGGTTAAPTAPKEGFKTWKGAGFTVDLPTTWKSRKSGDADLKWVASHIAPGYATALAAGDPAKGGFGSSVEVLTGPARGSLTEAGWRAALVKLAKAHATTGVTVL